MRSPEGLTELDQHRCVAQPAGSDDRHDAFGETSRGATLEQRAAGSLLAVSRPLLLSGPSAWFPRQYFDQTDTWFSREPRLATPGSPQPQRKLLARVGGVSSPFREQCSRTAPPLVAAQLSSAARCLRLRPLAGLVSRMPCLCRLGSVDLALRFIVRT
jgi:hypothetical protein